MTSTTGASVWVEGIATETPDHVIKQHEARGVMNEWLTGLSNQERPYSPKAFQELFDNAGVRTRHSVIPVEQAMKPTTFDQQTDLYLEHAPALAQTTAENALRDADTTADDIDMVITVSCTGFTVPALDAYLYNELNFRPDVRRLPIAELGCSAGAGAVGRAFDYLEAHPDDRVLVLSVELCSTNFQPEDPTRAQAIAGALFGDGAAGVVLTGERVSDDRAGPVVRQTHQHFFKDTLDFMGYKNTRHGTSIVLSPKIPAAVRQHSQSLVSDFLGKLGLKPTDVSKWIVHPGGPAIIDAFEQSVASLDRLNASRSVLNNVGNLSSATVLHVLKETMNHNPAPGSYGLMLAFGPGFNAEMSLLEWEKPST